jgi:hypothetical protein
MVTGRNDNSTYPIIWCNGLSRQERRVLAGLIPAAP